tara:strand:- start:19 stop:351 length:333 start_codon:yes stop_codon:yes gene_type:complete
MITLNFNTHLNISLQAGDMLYSSTIDNNNAYNIADNIKQIGTADIINNNSIIVNNEINTPNNLDYIMFAKDNCVNLSSLKGYYAEVKFVNDSKQKAELFSVAAEIQQSSK